MKSLHTLLFLALAAAPAFAQDPAAPVATLQVETGGVMASTGGEFATVSTGTALATGDRVMLSEGGNARLVYPNGCTQELTAPGVYVVQTNCTPVTGTVASGAVDSSGALVVVGVAAAAAAALVGMEDSDATPPPVSR